MEVELKALYNQTDIQNWKTSYSTHNIKDVSEPPIQKFRYFSKFFASDKILQQYSQYKSNRYAWQISISPDGDYIVILKNNNLELRTSKSDFNQIIFHCQIYKDFYPQWRTISWSSNSNYFAVSFSSGLCNVWDLQGSKLPLNTNCFKSSDFDIIIKALFKEVTKGRFMLYLLTLNGKILLYNIHNFKISNHFQSNIKFVCNRILCCELSINSNFMVIGTYRQDLSVNTNPASSSGILLFRLLDEDPFVTPQFQTDNALSISNSWFYFFNKKATDAAFKLRLSSDNQKIVSLHFSGKLSVWNFPSLSLLFTWQNSANILSSLLTSDSLKQRVFPRHFSDSNIFDVCWWNNEYITIALQNGRILILSLDQSIKYNNEDIALQPFPVIEEYTDKTFFALNCFSKSLMTTLSSKTNLEVVNYSPWNFLHMVFRYFLSDPDPISKSVKVENCLQTYNLVGFKLTTPEELFAIKINAKMYIEALELATQYGLDSDVVFQKQWRDSNKSINDVENILMKIKKRNWILNECLEQICEDIDSMKFLLKLGLDLTDIDELLSIDENNLEELSIDKESTHFRNTSISKSTIDRLRIEEFNLVQIEMIRIRMKLLNYYDKLIVYEKITALSKTKFIKEAFKDLKNLSSFEIAINFARQNNIIGLQVLLEFFENNLVQHILIILLNIPESVAPSKYKHLFNYLPSKTSDKTSGLITDLDWCESERFLEIYNRESTLNDAENYYYQINKDQSFFIITEISDCQLKIKKWFHSRVRHIEHETLNTENSLEMLQIWKEFDEEIDKSLEFNLRFLYEGVYNCQVTNVFIDLSEFELLSDFDKANMLMSKTSPDRFLNNFLHWIIPMLEEIRTQSSHRSVAFFRDYILNLGKKSLMCARKILEDNECMEKLVKIITFIDIVHVFLKMLCEDDEESNVNECANISRKLATLLPREGMDDADKFIGERKQLQDIDNYISVLRILNKYELKKTIKFVHDNKMNGELVENLITNMVFNYFKKMKSINKAIVKSAFTEIQISLSLVFKSVHPTLIYKNLLKSMLESGDKIRINLAGEFMTLSTKLSPIDDVEYLEKLIDFPEAVQCILVAVKNYINMSTFSKDGNMLLAKYCLQMIESASDELIAESEIIRCSEFLDKWHCSLVPIELRSIENRFTLLENCLDKNKHMYQEMEEVVEAGTYFYKDKQSNKKFKEGEALRLIAQHAWRNNDIANLEVAMASLLHRNHKPCWKECVMTLKLVDYPTSKKVQLGKYAVTYCPDNVLTETVKIVNDVEFATSTLTGSATKDEFPSTTNTNTNSNLIVQPIKYLSSGLTDFSSRINLKSLFDKSSDALLKIKSQVAQMGSQREVHDVLYKDDNTELRHMVLNLFYQENGSFSLHSENDAQIQEIVNLLTLSTMLTDDSSQANLDRMHLKMVQFNVTRDSCLSMIHAMHIGDLSLLYDFRNELSANTYTRALIYCMVALNLLLKYVRPFPEMNKLETDALYTILQPFKTEMTEVELSILESATQQYNDYLLLDEVASSLPDVSHTRFFSSVDYRHEVISQLSQFDDNPQLFRYAMLLADRYNVSHYQVSLKYFKSFVVESASSSEKFKEHYPSFIEVFDMERFIRQSQSLSYDLETHLSSGLGGQIGELKVILKLIPEQCDHFLLFKKSPSSHRRWMEVWDSIFTGPAKGCTYLDLCTGNKSRVVDNLKLVVDAQNVQSCSQLLTEFGLAEEFDKIKKQFSSVLANQTFWHKSGGDKSLAAASNILGQFEKSLQNFSLNDSDNCKDFIFNIVFQRSETAYIGPEAKVGILKAASKYVDGIVNGGACPQEVVANWSKMGLELTIWLEHVENTVVKVAENLRQLPTVSESIVVTSEYLPPDNYWQCLLAEMLLAGVCYQDLFTVTWDLATDTGVIVEALSSHIFRVCSPQSSPLPQEGLVERISQILEEIDDYMDCVDVQAVIERLLEEVAEASNDHLHRMLLNELILRVRKNRSKSNFPINVHIRSILRGWGLPVSDKVTFGQSNLHIVDSLMQQFDGQPDQMKIVPKVIELIELVKEDNKLWQCWIKQCVVRGAQYCSCVFAQFEDMKANRLYADRIQTIAKDAIESLKAFNGAEAIALSILMDAVGAVDQVQSILVAVKADPAEYAATMRNMNTKALDIIVSARLVPIYSKTLLYQRLVNYLAREVDDSSLVQSVIDQLKAAGLQDEATWLTSSSSHIGPAMKTLEMVSGFWKRFSAGNNP